MTQPRPRTSSCSQRAYDTIKAVRPTATVIGGALNPRGTDDPTGDKQTNSPTTFIRDLGLAYRASGRTTPIMDVFDEHVYADNSALPPSTAPAVTIAGPAADGTVSGDATDDIGVGGVELAVNGTVVGVKYAAPYSFTWKPAQAGRYTLELRAYDAAGNVGSVSVTVGAVRASRGGAASPGGWAFGAPPANDLFAAAQRVSSWQGHTTGSTAFASSEHGEPFRHSVWFTWHAPADGPLHLAAGNAHVSVYTGASISRLRRVALAGLVLDARRGMTYRIAVDGGRGGFALVWKR